MNEQGCRSAHESSVQGQMGTACGNRNDQHTG
jgi:hypothetical protein